MLLLHDRFLFLIRTIFYEFLYNKIYIVWYTGFNIEFVFFKLINIMQKMLM